MLHKIEKAENSSAIVPYTPETQEKISASGKMLSPTSEKELADLAACLESGISRRKKYVKTLLAASVSLLGLGIAGIILSSLGMLVSWPGFIFTLLCLV